VDPRHIIDRRRLLGLVLGGGGAALLTACGAPAPAPAAPPAPTAAAGAAPTPASGAAAGATLQPKSGGMLRAVTTGDIAPIDGHYHNPKSGLGAWIVYDPLIVYDDDFKPQPMLAERWDQSADGRTMTVTLRQGVRYHTGRELTSDDLLYNLNRILDPKITAGILTGFIPPETTWSAKDKYTVVLNAKQPWVNVLDFFSLFNMVDRDTMEGPDAKSRAVGTGPFVLAEWVPGDHAVYAKNPSYWQSGRPYLDGIQLTISKDPTVQTALLEGGAVDFSLLPALLDFNRLRSDPKYQALTLPNPGGFLILQPNPNVAPFVDKRVRQALNYAINRRRIAETVLLGLNRPTDLPWPPGTVAYEPEKELYYDFDLDKAKSLLGAAGASGMDFELLVTTTNPAYGGMSQIIQSDLASIGARMAIIQLEPAALLARINAHQFQAYMLGDAWASFEPVTPLTSDASLNYRVNNADFHDDTYTELVSSAATEVDPARRKQLYSQINDFLLDASFDMPIVSNPARALTSANLHGVGHRRNDFFTFTEAWLS
jgi:peptide/nickel transport system substrate-binding protein